MVVRMLSLVMCTDCGQVKKSFRGTRGEEFKIPGITTYDNNSCYFC